MARKKKLELEAAEAKACIRLALIEKKLEADLAELEEEQSLCGASEMKGPSVSVEEWLESGKRALEEGAAPDHGTTAGRAPTPPPPPGGNDYGTVHMLATALKDLAAASAPNNQMLSRISTPRDLPPYSGDPMDWLLFKQAYEESTQVCRFTPKENLWRLRKCLQGRAKDAVAALLITATSPDVIISSLQLQFGNPDVIMSRLMFDLKRLPPMPQDYHKEIIPFSVKVKNFVAAVQVIGQGEYLQGMSVTTLILSKIPTLLISKWTDYSYHANQTHNAKSKLLLLTEFLEQEAIKTSQSSVSLTDSKIKQAVLLHSEMKSSNLDANTCKFCRAGSHLLTDCKRFKKCLRKERWRFAKQSGICFKCLVSHHDRDTCTAPMCDKDGCGLAHHKLLHYAKKIGSVNIVELPPSELGELHKESVTFVQTGNYKVLLKVVPITIHGPSGTLNVLALLDDGSTVSLISSELLKQLGIKGLKQTMTVCGAWDNKMECETESVKLNITNRDGNAFEIKVTSFNNLNLPDVSHAIDVDCFKYLSHIKSELCTFKKCKPQILLGQDNCHLLLPLQVLKGRVNEPYATQTPLGWCLHGCVPTYCTNNVNSTYLISEVSQAPRSEEEHMLRELHDEVRRSFSIDAMGVGNKPRQHAEDLQALEHLERTAVLVNGRWQVGLPWRDSQCKLPDSYPLALSRLKGISKKMNANHEYAERYAERIAHLLNNNYAEEFDGDSPMGVDGKLWYLPHFGVDNPNKKKMRLVFDAAAKSQGLCLNDFLLKGPDLLNSLFGIMLRFREKQIAVTGDIKDMFLQVKVSPEDRNAFRFLWKNNPNDSSVKTYVMSSLIFGANCSPFVAQFIKNKNTEPFESSMPAAVAAIRKQHYVDDYIDCMDSEEAAVQVVKDVMNIHQKGGFELRNFTSNSETLLQSLPPESVGSTNVRFKTSGHDTGERTLGLIWYPTEDTLGFDVSLKRIPECIVKGEKRPTKREMLKVIMSIFDVYGFLSPFTIKGNIILQDTWRLNIGWDDVISDDINDRWVMWLDMLQEINTIRIPRFYQAPLLVRPCRDDNTPPPPPPPLLPLPPTLSPLPLPSSFSVGYDGLQLRVFCDASTKAMCAVAYWRWICNDKINVAFISSKCRVAPVKATTVPRLELQAAVLAARLADTICREHTINTQDKYYWCDSTTVLHWIRNDLKNYKPYVANRLGEIDELSYKANWRYVPTKLNVADIATRDNCSMATLRAEWFYGPEFLHRDSFHWPSAEVGMVDLNLECVTVTVLNDISSVVTASIAAAIPNPERFSSWLRLVRSTCVVLSFIDKCKKLDGTIDRKLLERAEFFILKFSQGQSFAGDIATIKQGRPLSKNSKLRTLTPFVDEHGLLRVGGRIDAAASTSYDVRHPIILDGHHVVSKLIAKYYHVKAAHGNQETVVNLLKEKYWIIRMRPTVKYVAIRCMLCKIKKCRPQPPLMGDLPKARLAHHNRPFTHCGLDLFGPMEVVVGRRRERRYGVLFTCLTVRAVHIELVSSLTTDSLIMSLRRMAARRGWPAFLYSDNGTNLRGADKELKRSIKEIEMSVIDNLINYGTEWVFIPPASPHWGGAWERLIRSVKDCLRVVLKERAPRDEVLSTLIAEVENMVNSRPLHHVSVEPGSCESLTPNHFLLGSSSNLPPLGVFNKFDFLNNKKQWRISQRLSDMFWARWVKQVLPEMLPRGKWCQEQRPLKVGDLVFVADPAAPRNCWPRGVVLKVYPGRDNRIRVVDIKTQTGILKRSAARVAAIPVDDEC